MIRRELNGFVNFIGGILGDWTPRGYDTEDEYTQALFRYLNKAVAKELGENDPDIEIELWPDTSEPESHPPVPDSGNRTCSLTITLLWN